MQNKNTDNINDIWDIHTHVLPGIDDGAKDWEMSLEMMRKSYDTGVRTIVATPHWLPWKDPASPQQIRTICLEAEQRFTEQTGKKLRILPGNELFYHADLPDELQQRKALTLNDTSYVLVEFPTEVRWKDLLSGLQNLQRHSYRPILAHMERYGCLEEEDRVEKLCRIGILLQMNQHVFCGGIFDRRARRSQMLLRNGYISFVASDMHNLSSRPPLKSENLHRLQKILSPEETELVLTGNSAKILSV